MARAMRRLKWRMKLTLRSEWSAFVLSTCGTVVFALGIMIFVIPNRFPDAGVSGLAVLSSYLWGISPAWLVGAINVILLVWGWKELSPRLMLWTVYTVSLFTLLLTLLADLPAPRLEDRLLVAVLAGVFKGIGSGLVFQGRSSLGGTDVVVMVLRKRYGVEVGKFTFYINLVILGLSIFVVGLQLAVYGLVSVYIGGVVTDGLLRSFDRRKQVMIISQAPERVAAFIMDELHRGVTLLHGEGGYTHHNRQVVLCTLTPRQTMEVKLHLADTDSRAFMIVSDASEVLGRGFKPWKRI